MNHTLKMLAASVVLVSTSATAANYAIEARGDAMGGVGVVSANFLTAPFYNPAIVAIYRRNDDVGMIIPSLGLSYNDKDEMVDNLDTAAELIGQGASADPNRLQTTLDNLSGSAAKLELGGVVAFAIPNQFIAANVFGKAYTETFAQPDIYSGSADADPDVQRATNAELSTVNAVSVGVTELGLSLAKYQTFMGQHIAYGVTPKLQRIYTYVYASDLKNFDIMDATENGTGDTAFNMDAGFLWFYGPWRAGISASNLISRDITTERIVRTINATNGETRNIDVSYNYQLKPLYTVGFGLVADYATLSVDYDLNEEERYSNFSDNTQMLRVGGEIDLLRQLKLRAGWKRNLAYSNTDDTVTAGIGISPLNLFQLDIGASYTNKNSMGAYINFLGSY